ncbi:MAG: rhomboid family intramembrane serine protease [Treponema sp.]|nr:rhomboid family intramembrane serine protease [Treponema sp.]
MNIIRKPFRYASYHIVYWLIGINVLVFTAGQLLGSDVRYMLTVYLSMIPALIIEEKWVWTFITYMFMHGSVSHILFNMLGLFIFGTNVERQMGSKEFLLFYLLTGMFAGIFSFAVYYYTGNHVVALMGASGALYAVQLAYAVLFPDSVIYIWGLIPLRAPVMVLGFTALSLFFVISGRGGNVAHLTHLAGFAFAWIYFMVRFGVNPWRRLTMK